MTAGRVWTEQAIRDLGVSTDLVTAASVLGFGRTTAYAMVAAGTFPVPVLRVGRIYRVPVAPLLRLLGLTAPPPTDPPPPEPPPAAGDATAGRAN